MWEPPARYGGAPDQWRGWRGDFLHATIHRHDHGELPWEACVVNQPIGRYGSVEAAMLAVRDHDDDSGD